MTLLDGCWAGVSARRFSRHEHHGGRGASLPKVGE